MKYDEVVVSARRAALMQNALEKQANEAAYEQLVQVLTKAAQVTAPAPASAAASETEAPPTLGELAAATGRTGLLLGLGGAAAGGLGGYLSGTSAKSRKRYAARGAAMGGGAAAGLPAGYVLGALSPLGPLPGMALGAGLGGLGGWALTRPSKEAP